MCLLSCFLGQGARRARSTDSHTATQTPAHHTKVPAGEANLSSQAHPAPTACPAFEAAEPSLDKSPTAKTSGANASSHHAIPVSNRDDSARTIPGAVRGPSLATQLLNGLSFSTRVLGTGSYGIVLHGSFDNLDVAIRFIVSGRHTVRAAVQEMTLGVLPAITHPLVCKIYDTRSALLTDDLFDELEVHRERHLRRLDRQRRLLQQQQNPFAADAADADGGGGGRRQHAPGKEGKDPAQKEGNGRPEERWCSGAAEAATDTRLLGPAEVLPGGPRGMRLPQFAPVGSGERGVYVGGIPVDRPQPLESSVPHVVLLEVLYRLGACVGQSVTMVISEHCSRGTLSRAICRGIFEPCAMWGLHVVRRALVRTAAEIARSMLHLHRAGVVHGDLKPGNVLLQSSRGDRRGFVAKISDVGLSRLLLSGANSVDMDTWGTPLYMAPEALMGHTSKASDVWSFGVMLSEMLTRKLPYSDCLEPDASPAHVIMRILDGSLELSWPAVGADMLPSSASDGIGPDADDAPQGTAAYLARRCGLAFPATRSLGATPATRSLPTAATNSDDATAAPSSLMGTSASTDCGTTTVTLTTGGASDAGTVMPTPGAEADVAAGGGGGASADDDMEGVLACLVNLGKRCTYRDASYRPCFSEVLGELIDMEMVLKTTRPSRMAAITSAKEFQDTGVRTRSRLSMTVPAAPALLPPPVPPPLNTPQINGYGNDNG